MKEDTTGAAAIVNERARAVAEDGFRGELEHVSTAAAEGGHILCVSRYRFPDGSTSLFVEVAEAHDGARRARIMPLSAAVHILQNVTDAERWVMEGR